MKKVLSTLVQNDKVQAVLVIAILLGLVIVTPLLIRVFFRGLLFMMEEPLLTLVGVLGVLAGMFINEKLS